MNALDQATGQALETTTSLMPAQRDLFCRALSTWGLNAQIDMCIEECSELIVALQHFKRGRCNEKSVCEELADVQITSAQLALFFGERMVASSRRDKLARLAELLEVERRAG